jgi:2-phosphoglycerate kinase
LIMVAALSSDKLGWRVLLLGGASGVGKSTIAAQLGRHLGIPWLQVDDFRLALMRSGFALPDADAVSSFDGPGGLLTHAELLAPAIEVVIENHIDQHTPAILEGDPIIPALLDRPSVRRNAASGWLRAVFLYEEDVAIMHRNMQARGRTLASQEHALKNWRYGEWLQQEAQQRHLPIMATRPWETLHNRILTVAQAPLVIGASQ